MNNKAEAIKEIIRLKERVMMESQSAIRQAESMLENMRHTYKKAMEDKLYLQEQLIEELKKGSKN